MTANLQLQKELKAIRLGVLILTVSFFALLEFLMFVNSKNHGKEKAQNWLEKNGPSIAQAIFLENLHAVNGLVERSFAESDVHSLSIAILNTQGENIAESSQATSKAGNFVLRFARDHLFDFRMEAPIYFDQIQVGTAVIAGHQSLLSLGQHTLILLISIALFYVATNRLLNRFHKVVWQRILTPLTDLTVHMRAQDSLHGSTPSPPPETIDEVRELYLNFAKLSERSRASEAQLRDLEKSKAITEIARQVAHDIRSPVSALNMVASVSDQLPEANRQLIRKATQRINDIANQLLAQSRSTASSAMVSNSTEVPTEKGRVMLVAVIDELLSEVRLQHRSSSAEIRGQLEEGYGLFVDVVPSDLCRALSNLINNSVEARSPDRPCVITVSLRREGNHASIEVQDNGTGIPQDQLSRLGERGFAFGKAAESGSGHGLGLSQVAGFAKASHGTMSIQSEAGRGTTVSIRIPTCEAPPWFTPHLELTGIEKVVSVDDDASIHEIWHRRLVGLRNTGAVDHIRRTDPVLNLAFESREERNKALFLVDFEFAGHPTNGLVFIEDEGLQQQSVLVTSRYDDPKVQRKAQELNVKIIPKNLAHLIPIRM